MIEQQKARKNRWDKDEILKAMDVENPSADDVLNYLLGDADGYTSRFVLYEYNTNKKSLINRINLIWFMPLFTITIPIQWLIFGKIGVNRNSRIGKIVDKLINID